MSYSSNYYELKKKKKEETKEDIAPLYKNKATAFFDRDIAPVVTTKETKKEKEEPTEQELLDKMTPTQRMYHNKVGGFVDTNWGDRVSKVTDLILSGGDTDYKETDKLLGQLKAQQERNNQSTSFSVLAKSKGENSELQRQYNSLIIAKQRDILSKTKLDGTNRTVLEEMQLLAEMKSGKEKDKRKAAVFKKMEELGIKADDYALFSGDKNFTWDSFGGWLKNSAQAGFNSFNKGVASTADLILGKPLQALGWENNPVSLAKEYYDSTYESSKVSQQLYADRLGGGKGLDFAGEAVEGTTGAVPQALMALMSMGTSLSTTSSSLATKAAYETGNVLTKAGLTVEGMMKNPQYWLSFIRTYGSDYEQAKEMGASDEVAVLGATLTSLVNSGIEIGIDGGSGIQGLPDDIADGGSKLLAWAIAGAEEGGEEGLQKFVNEAVTKTMYNHDADILNPKEYGKEMAIGTLSGWGLGAGQIAVASGVNAYNEKQANKLTENEQKVVDKVVEEKVAEAEKGGKVTRSEKAKITKEVIDQLNKGYISTDTIEEVFGDRSSYDSLVQEADEFNALYTMESGKMTRQQQVRLAELEAKNEANPYETAVKAEKDKLSQGVFELVKDSRLAESYNEKTRKGQKFEADLSQYDKKYHATIQKAIDSGILNNSNRTHEFVDIVSKISADKGVPFDFANNEKIKESGFAVEGMTVDGYITADGITINIDSPRAWQSTVGHEVTHILEGTDLYDEVKTTLFDYAKSKGEYQSRYDSIVKRYKEGTDYEAELVADLVGDYLFQDADFVKKLSVEHRNVFQKIYDEVKYLSKVVTAGSKEARDLEKVRKAFEEAYRADTKAQTETKYSISETTDGRLVAVVDSDILSNIDTSTWDNATKKKAKKAASEELKKFADGFTINGIDFIGNKDTRAEYTRADYSEALAHQNPTAYLDKMRASAVIDDVIQVATDWKNDGELKHKREDYVDFVRGKTLIMSGDRTYKAIVLAGITSGGRAIFYDVVSVYPNSFKVKKAESSTTVSASELPNSIKDSTTHNLAHNEANVNAKYSLSDGTKDVAKGQQLWYNNKRGEEYVRTDEFRSLQAESQRMSDEEWNFYLRGGKNEDVRRRVSTVLQRQMDAWRSSGGTHNGRLRLSGKGNQFNMYEGVDPSLFHDIFEVSRKYLQNGELVDLHEIETTEDGIGYNDCYNYLSEDGLSGFSITPDGDLISVFNASDKGGFLRAISDTVKAKAKTLDCYASPNQNLMEMYQKFFGFKTASVMDYNMEFDHDSIAENHNRPKIAFMVNTESNVETRSFTEEQYDEALEYRNSFINRATNNEVVFFMPKNADTDIDARRSISKNGEQSKKHGNFHTPATELKYAPAKETSEPTKATISKPENVAPVAEKSSAVAPTNEVTDLFSDDLAPVYSELDKLELEKQALEDRMMEMSEAGDWTDLQAVDERYNAVVARIEELEKEISEASGIDNLTDEDAPPEISRQYDSQPDTTPIAKEDIDGIAQEAKNSLAVTSKQMGDLRKLIEEYSQSENPSREQLFNDLKEKFGTYKERVFDQTISDAKKRLQTTKLYLSDIIIGDIADFADFKRRNRGKVILSANGGLDVDVAYQELNGLYPDLFPESISNPTDQLLRMVDVANMNSTSWVDQPIDDSTLWEVANDIADNVADSKQVQKEAEANELAGAAFDSLMETADQYAPIAPTAPVAKDVAPTVAEKPIAPVKEQHEAIKPKTEPKVRADNAEQKTAKVLTEDPQTPKRKSAVNWIKEHILRRGAVIEDIALETGNRELQAKFDNIRRAEGMAQEMIGKGKGNAKALLDIWNRVESSGKLESFQNYLYHMLNIDRMTLDVRYGTPNKAVFGDDITAETSAKCAERLLKNNPEFKVWAKQCYDYCASLRQDLVDGGVISQELSDRLAEMYPHYVPVGRVDHKGKNIDVPLDTKKTGINAPIKRATGGNSDIRPVFKVMAERTIQTYKAIAKNRFGVELKNTLGTVIGSDAYADTEVLDSVAQHEELLQEGKNGQAPTFTVFENGEKVTFEITDDIYEALKPSQFTYTNKTLNKIGNIRRDTLTTFSPSFPMTNPFKDLGDIIVNSQHPVRTYAEIPEAAWQLISKGNWYQERTAHGGSQDTYFSKGAYYDSKTNEFKKQSAFSKVAGFPFEKIRQANEFFEQVPRLAEYIASRKAGRSIDASMLDSARVTTNFGAAGDFTNMLNRNGFTFLGASVEGFNQQVRNVREAKAEGLKGWAKLAGKYLVAGLPVILLNHALWDDDEDYEELSDYVKQNYYIVGKFGDGRFVRIPKGRAVAVIQNAFEQMENLITGNDEVDLKAFADLAFTNLAPNDPLNNNVLSPIVQTFNNRTWYGEDLVPTRLQDLPAAEQYDESTDAISRWLGEKAGGIGIDISPVKVNYLLDQYSGGVGDMLLPMITPEAESGDNSILGNMIAPLKDKFTTDSTMNNKNVSTFYDTKDKLATNAKSSKATDDDILKSKYINSVNDEMSELYKQKREIQNMNIPDDKKYSMVRDVQRKIDDLAEESLGTYENVRIQGEYATVGDRRFLKKDGSWTKLSEEQLAKESSVTSALGISSSEYWSNKDEYDFAYEKPEKYAVAKSVGGYDAYKTYSGELYDIKADKDENGKSINGSRKEKVIEYINNLDADYGERIILFKSEYPSDDTYNYEIIDYLNSRQDISYDEMVTILKELGFNVDREGNITWD